MVQPQTPVAARPNTQRSRATRWITKPIFVLLVLLPGLIAFSADSNHTGAALLAYANCLIAGLAAMYFLRQGTLPAMIPVLYLIWQTVAWPVSSIFFAIFAPEASYTTISYVRRFMDGNVRLQLTLMLFMCVYLAVMRLFVRTNMESVEHTMTSSASRRMGHTVLIVAMGIIGLNAVSKLREFPFVLQYIADGAFNYLNGLFLVVGALLRQLPFQTVVTAVAFLGGAAFFYALGNARGMALLPFCAFAFGMLFQSGLSPRIKTQLVVVVIIALPLYLAVADSTRRLLGGIGFENLEQRMAALSRAGEFLDAESVFVRSFGRLFSTGGHSIVLMTPDARPYLEFSPGAYFGELLQRLLPGVLVYQPFYSTTYRLTAYDIRINEDTSVELSMVGALWMIGGWMPLIIGAAALGVLHALVANWIGAATRRSFYKGLFYLAMVAPQVLWTQNLDIITHTRFIVWLMLAGTILYHTAIKPVVGEPRSLQRVVVPLDQLHRVLRPA